MVGVPDGVGWAGALQDVVVGLAPGALPAGRRAELTGRAGVDAVPLRADLVAPALLVARAAGLAGPVDANGAVGALAGAAADPLAGAVLAHLVVEAVRLGVGTAPGAESVEADAARTARRVPYAGLGLRTATLEVFV